MVKIDGSIEAIPSRSTRSKPSKVASSVEIRGSAFRLGLDKELPGSSACAFRQAENRGIPRPAWRTPLRSVVCSSSASAVSRCLWRCSFIFELKVTGLELPGRRTASPTDHSSHPPNPAGFLLGGLGVFETTIAPAPLSPQAQTALIVRRHREPVV